MGVLVVSAAGFLAACNFYDSDRSTMPARASSEIPASTLAAMDRLGTDRNAPVLIRAYKKDSELEIWKLTSSGQYALLKTYPVCRWSGQLGPKTREGDRQVPEGFYTVSSGQMNPNSALWLSFNVGYPNALERSLGFSGGDIMVHGTCSSRGCYAMTNEQIEEIYAVVREAFQGGQKQIQFQSFPFRMTAENMARFRNDPNISFWKNLKQGSDRFDVTKREVLVGYCGNRYAFGSSSQPSCAPNDHDDATAQVNEKTLADEEKAAQFAAANTPAIRMQYADGDQHPYYRSPDKAAMLKKLADAGEFSRPEALASVSEIQTDTKGKVTTANAYSSILNFTSMKGTLTAESQSTATPATITDPTSATKTNTAGMDASLSTSHAAAPQSATETSSGSFLQNLFVTAPPVVDDPDVSFPASPPLPPTRG
jgi:murein L,D-transpeptidase YafK